MFSQNSVQMSVCQKIVKNESLFCTPHPHTPLCWFKHIASYDILLSNPYIFNFSIRISWSTTSNAVELQLRFHIYQKLRTKHLSKSCCCVVFQVKIMLKDRAILLLSNPYVFNFSIRISWSTTSNAALISSIITAEISSILKSSSKTSEQELVLCFKRKSCWKSFRAVAEQTHWSIIFGQDRNLNKNVAQITCDLSVILKFSTSKFRNY